MLPLSLREIFVREKETVEAVARAIDPLLDAESIIRRQVRACNMQLTVY